MTIPRGDTSICRSRRRPSAGWPSESRYRVSLSNEPAAFRQKLGNVFVGERISQVPSHAKNDHLARELTSLERIGWSDRHDILRCQTPVPHFAIEPVRRFGGEQENKAPGRR